MVPTGPDRFDEQPLQLTPGEALNVLGRPLRVFLENGRYDRTFLLAFADGASHAKIVEAERAGWLVFETAGGITELVVRVEDAATQPSSREVFRAMYLCDSDARAPGQPDERAASVGKALVALGTHHHRRPDHFGAVLTRRAAENYAPPGDVLTWAVRKFGGQAHELIQQATRPDGRRHLASGTGNPGSDRRHLLAAIALRELQSQERTDVLAHLDMKHGRLHRDTPRNADIIWNQLDDFQQAALDNGFGEGFSGNFYGTSRALRDGTKEITRFLAKILERM